MLLKNAIKKLSKHTKVEKNGDQFYGEINGYVVGFMANSRIEENTSIYCIYIRNKNNESNIMIDYFAETFYGNLNSAIKSALN